MNVSTTVILVALSTSRWLSPCSSSPDSVSGRRVCGCGPQDKPSSPLD